MRTLIALLLLANLVFFVWSQGWLDDVAGVRAMGDREPERLTQQVRPEMIKILPPQAASVSASVAETRLACLQAGPFDEAEASAAEAALSTVLPAGSWQRVKSDSASVWMVYMGRYDSRSALQKKEEELLRLKVPFESVKNAAEFEPGLSLGRFSERSVADVALSQFTQRGVRSARVVELGKPGNVQLLRIVGADADFAAKVSGLKLDALGIGFAACAR